MHTSTYHKDKKAFHKAKVGGVEYTVYAGAPASHGGKRQLHSLNLRLQEDLLQQLREASKKKDIKVTTLASKFLLEGLERIRQEELRQKLVESYQYLAKENAQLLGEFSKTDLEGWEKE